MSHDAGSETTEGELERLRRRVAELEAAHQRSQQILQAVIDHLPGLVHVRDREYRYLAANRTGAEPVGGLENVLGKRDIDLVPPEVVEGWRANDEKILATGIGLEGEETDTFGENGIRVFRAIKFPIRDAAGDVFAIGGISFDITAQKRAEKELRERDALLQSILRHAPLMMYALDEEGVVSFAEGKALASLGMSPEALVGRSIFALWGGQPARVARIREALAGRPINAVEEFSARAVETWYLPVQDGAGHATSVIAVGLDVTERRRAEQEQSLQAQLIQAQRAAIRELSTPLIPLTREAVVVPLVGSMDSLRAQQFMETLLHGVSTRGATIAIVDVTGVSTVDTRVAEVLIKTAKAISLLGARTVMTGLSPAMAQAFVALGVSFDGIVVRGSLQDGIAHVLAAR